MDRPGISFCSRTTYDDNAITNAVEIYVTPRYFLFPELLVASVTLNLNLILLCFRIISGAVHFTASNNDCGVRDFDMEKYQLSKHFHFLWPVNVSSLYRDPVCFRLVNIHLIFFHVKVLICNMLIIGSITTVKTR